MHPSRQSRPVRPVRIAAVVLAALLPFFATHAAAQKGGIAFGALLPLTGPLADKGRTSQAALKLAEADIRSYLAASGSGGSFSILIEDTGSDPQKALAKLKNLADKGVRLVIGPASDAETAAVEDFAAGAGIVLLSPGSAAQYLARKDDTLFRLSPSNTYQAEALTALIKQEGNTIMVPLWRGDTVGDELMVHAKARFRQLGGEAAAGVRYDPDRTDFAGILDELDKELAQVRAEKPSAKPAIVFVGGNEVVPIFKDAAKRRGLAGLPWYGSDATALNDAIAKDPESAAFAMRTRFASPRYGEGGANVYTQIERRIAKETDLFPDTQSAAAYDAAWLGFLAADSAQSMDAGSLKRFIPLLAERTYGVTGWLALNEYGDRREDWDFDFWALRQEGDTFFWEKIARYQFEPGMPKELYIGSPRK
ncbi:MAG: ABC transporter substrate-binding protein [Thermodesulfobacteriota bacterium]